MNEKTRTELIENEKKYRSLVENLNVGVYRATPGVKGRFVDVNQAFVRILGYENKEEVMKLDVSDIYVNPADRKRFNDKIIGQGFVKNEELQLKRKDGTKVIVADTAVAVYDNEGKLICFDGILEDISEKKQAERDLRIRDSAISSSINAIAIADLEGNLTYVNPSFLVMWGYDDEKQVLGRPAVEFWHDEKQASETFKALAEKGGWIGELVARKREGSFFNVQLSTSLVEDEHGNPVCMMGSFVDITERKKAEEAIKRHSHELAIINVISAVVSQSLNIEEILNGALEKLMELLNLDVGGIYLIDPEYQKMHLAVHRGVSEEFALELEFITIDRRTLEAATAEGRLRRFILSAGAVLKDRKELRRILSAMKREGLSLTSGILTLLKAKETILGLLVLASREPRQFSEAEQALLVSIGQQIAVAIENARLYKASQQELDVRKKAEEALRESEEKFRYLFESARDVIITLDLKGNVTSVNKVVEEYGFKRDELLGKYVLTLAQKKYWPRLLRELTRMRQGRPVEGEIELITPKGKKTAEYRGSPIRRGEEVVSLQTILRDITERKYAEKMLKEYSEKLEKMVEQRTKELREAQDELIRKERLAILGQLSSSIGHELRNPLGNISSSAYFLNMKLKGTDEKIGKHLDIIETNIQRANRIITDLLDFSRTRKPVLVESNVNDIVREALGDVRMSENISVETHLEEEMVRIPLDLHQIQVAFMNIIINAVQAMPRGGTLTITTEMKGDSVHILFEDSGEGISKEDLQRIFEPLFTTKAKGIGLGLAIVKNIVEGHRGAVEVRSEKGVGTTFVVKLPRK